MSCQCTGVRAAPSIDCPEHSPTRPSDLVTVVCQWFAKCERPATGVVGHPVLEAVPTCGECAKALDLTLIGGHFHRLPDGGVEFRSYLS